MITEDYVNYESAKLFKEKGFKEWCSQCYGVDVRHNGKSISFDEECELKEDGKENEIEYIDGGKLYNYGFNNNIEGKTYAAPTLQTAVKWIRNMHKMHIEIRITNHSISSLINIVKYYWVVFSTEDCKWMAESTLHNPKAFDTVEEAYENGIEYTLKNLIKDDKGRDNQ
jgi:hypothetical protein